MINNPVFSPIRTVRETRMSYTMHILIRILVKHTSCGMLVPRGWIYRIAANQLQLAQAIVPIVTACSRVHDELLARERVDELLWGLLRRQANIDGPITRGLLPRLVGPRDDLPLGFGARHRPRIAHPRDAQHRGPRDVLTLPARVHVIQPCGVHEVGAVDGKLIVRVELRLEGTFRLPGVGGAGFQHEHSVVDGRAVEVAEHVLHR